MAKSGSKTVAVTSYDSLVFNWRETAQSTANNTTTVAWSLVLKSVTYGAIESTASKDWSVTVNGQKVQGTNTVGIAANSTKTLASGSTVVTHDADGSKTFAYSFSQEFDITFSGSHIGTITGSGTGTLNTIPRASQPSLITWPQTTNDVGNFGDTIAIHMNRASSDFTHTVRYEFGTRSGTIATKVETGTTWTIPLNFMDLLPAATQGSGRVFVDTYKGSTLVGTKYTGFTAHVPSTVKPSCSVQVLDATNYQATYGNLVRGLSKLKVKVTGSVAYSSPIAAYSTTAAGAKYTAAEFTTPALRDAGTVAVSATVTDRRGRTSAAASASFQVIDYNAPTINSLVVHRCDANGNEDDQGEYIKATFSAAVSPLNNKNSAAYKLRYKKTTTTSFTEVAFSDLAGKYTVANKSHVFAASGGDSFDVEVVAADDIKTTTRATSASTAFTLMNWGADGHSMGIGKVAEESDTLQNALHLNQIGNRFAASSPGVAGTQGFVLMANIEIIAANADTPITFVLSRRQAPTTMTVHVTLRNSAMTSSSVNSITYEGTNYDAYLSPTGDMSWGLYVLKGSNYDTITIQDWYTSKTMQSRARVTFPGTLVDQVPTPYYKATPAQLRSLLDYIYPVGSIYIAYSHNDPATMFGGSWVRIENAFLWGCDKDGGIGTTGGEKTHTLTVNELPSHTHGSVYSGNAAGTKTHAWLASGGSSMAYGTVATGGGAAHNNMPPYVQVSIWRRTA